MNKKKYIMYAYITICTIITIASVMLSNKETINAVAKTISENNVAIVEIPTEKIIYKTELVEAEVTDEDIYLYYWDLLADGNHEEWYMGYKVIMENAQVKTMDIYDAYSTEDILYLQRMVETETFECSFDAKVNVACAAINRLESGLYGDTLTEIITAPNQFAYYRTEITEDTRLACEFAYEIMDTTEGATSFHSGEKISTFNGLSYRFTDEAGHHFY